jgi:hypothetical protein
MVFAAVLVGLTWLTNATFAFSAPSTPSAVKDAGSVPAEWAGVYTTDRQGPPGFKTIFPYNLLNEEIPKHMQPWALAKQQVTSWSDDREAVCKLAGFSNMTTFEGQIKLLPSPGELTIIEIQIELGGVRRIHLDRAHPKKLAPTWLGDSVAHWDGDTLVIDTVGLTDKSWLMDDREPHTDALEMIERMRMVLGGTYLEIQTTVEDPKALTSPYMYTRLFKKSNSEMRENVCNENTAPWKRQKEANDKAAATAADLAAANASPKK